MHAFHRSDPLVDDASTRQLLEAIATGIRFRRVRDSYPLVKKLTKYVILNPLLTYRVMRRIVDGYMELRQSGAQFHVGHFDDDLVNIVLTLHRQNDLGLRSDSLTLFEDLMDLEVGGAFEKLRELDLRPKR
ncbi:MAG: hypothetical protein U0936_24565 [Planctomycetaceae bacterium]